MRPTGTRYTLTACRRLRLPFHTFEPGALVTTYSLDFALGLVRSGSAEPKDSATADALELAWLLRLACTPDTRPRGPTAQIAQRTRAAPLSGLAYGGAAIDALRGTT